MTAINNIHFSSGGAAVAGIPGRELAAAVEPAEFVQEYRDEAIVFGLGDMAGVRVVCLVIHLAAAVQGDGSKLAKQLPHRHAVLLLICCQAGI